MVAVAYCHFPLIVAFLTKRQPSGCHPEMSYCLVGRIATYCNFALSMLQLLLKVLPSPGTIIPIQSPISALCPSRVVYFIRLPLRSMQVSFIRLADGAKLPSVMRGYQPELQTCGRAADDLRALGYLGVGFFSSSRINSTVPRKQVKERLVLRVKKGLYCGLEHLHSHTDIVIWNPVTTPPTMISPETGLDAWLRYAALPSEIPNRHKPHSSIITLDKNETRSVFVAAEEL